MLEGCAVNMGCGCRTLSLRTRPTAPPIGIGHCTEDRGRHSLRRTFVVTFDYSSLVLLELLARQHERSGQGQEPYTRITSVYIVNGGLFADAHSHPRQTTPLLKSPAGRLSMWAAQRSPALFARIMRNAALYSRTYRVSAGELRDLHSAITRRNGAAFMSRAAGFVDEHRRYSERWDFKRLYLALRETVAFHIAGSVEDPYEPRQILATRERLGGYGVAVRLFPGGHLTTSEHPGLLADAIRDLARA